MQDMRQVLEQQQAQIRQQDEKVGQQDEAIRQQQLQLSGKLSAALRNVALMPAVVSNLGELTKTLSDRSKPGLIDIKGVGKPCQFDNKEESFLRWASKTESVVGQSRPMP